MKAKDKVKLNKRISMKSIIIFFTFTIILLNCVVFYNYYFAKKEVYAKETADIKISNASKINIDEMIANNTKIDEKEEIIVEEIDLEYITKYQTNPELPKGIMQVVQEGREGKVQITKKRIYESGELITEEEISNKITKASVNKIVEVGAGNSKSTYKVKIGDNVYVTSDRAGIMVEPSDSSQKVATLTKGQELKISSIEKDWYRVTGIGVNGYIKTENTTYINPNKKQEEQEQTSSGGNIAKLSFNMALNKPSGLSLEQFKKVLTDSKDKNKIFQNNAEYFYYIEKQYNINGIFVAAVGIHESAWGTSKIALDKHNLFGYKAYDSNPYQNASQFTDYSECIDLIARVFVKYYLNPKGTSIYSGEIATATYYNGNNLTAVNKRYATDKTWSNKVYEHMKYLYNKL